LAADRWMLARVGKPSTAATSYCFIRVLPGWGCWAGPFFKSGVHSVCLGFSDQLVALPNQAGQEKVSGFLGRLCRQRGCRLSI
jgi:hypothetical protein